MFTKSTIPCLFGALLWGLVFHMQTIDVAADQSVTVSWNVSWQPNLAGYRVYYGTESGSYSQSLDAGNNISKELTGLNDGTTYFCAVTVYNTFGLESDYSEEISFTFISNPAEADSDGDGLSDLFEETYGGGGDLDHGSDQNGDGMSVLVEYVHGLDPTKPRTRPLAKAEPMDVGGEDYLCIRYLVDPLALAFVGVQLERAHDPGTGDLSGWVAGQSVHVSTTPSLEHPGLVEVVERSQHPMSAQRLEVFRLRYDVLAEIALAASTDSDGDGLSDLFEITYGEGGNLSPTADLNGDGIVALVESVHGLDPTKVHARPLLEVTIDEIDGTRYLHIKYLVDPQALGFVEVQVERRQDPSGVIMPPGNFWTPGQTVQVSSTASPDYPGLMEIVERSTIPVWYNQTELLRLRYDVLTP